MRERRGERGKLGGARPRRLTLRLAEEGDSLVSAAWREASGRQSTSIRKTWPLSVEVVRRTCMCRAHPAI